MRSSSHVRGHTHAGGLESSEADLLETDVMRFMAILAFCLVAVFALVQSAPFQPQPALPESSSPRVAAARVEPVIPAPRRPAQPQPPPLPARVLEPPDAAPAVVAAVLDEVITPAPAALPETPPDAPETAAEPASGDVGFTLRFESDAALQRLVGQRRVEVYALVGARSFGLWARAQALGFVEHTSPPRLHVMAPETVPASMRAAFERDARTSAAAVETWGVTLPAPTRTQIDALMHERAGGTLVIDEHGDVRLATHAPTERPS